MPASPSAAAFGDDEILGLDWPDFLEWFGERFQPGEHLSIAAPTGAGKTTFGTGILDGRPWVVGLDVKGGDKTLAKTGWRRITGEVDRFGHWLPHDVRRDIREGKPARLIVGRKARTFAEVERNWPIQARVLERCFAETNWTVYIPDLQLLTDPSLGGVTRSATMLWIAARDRGVSLVTDMQQFAWTPRLARSQPRWFVIGYTKDFDSVEDLGRAAGRSNAEIRGMVAALKRRPFSWLVFSNNPRDPVVVTIPLPKKQTPPPGRRAAA